MRRWTFCVAAVLLVACRTSAAEPAKAEPVKTEPAKTAPAVEQPKTEPAAAEPQKEGLEVIILGGGKEVADAEAWKKRWDGVSAVYSDLIKLSKGYPKSLKSDELPGLNPGYHIAILGVCKSGQVAAPLAVIKSIYPGAYARQLSGDHPEVCPQLHTQAKVYASETLKQKDGWRLAVHIYFRQAGIGNNPGERREPPDPMSGYYEVIAAVFDASNDIRGYDGSNIYQSMPDLLDAPGSCELSLERTSSSVVLHAACDKEAAACSGNLTHLVEDVTFRIRGMSLEHKIRVLEKDVAGFCD